MKTPPLPAPVRRALPLVLATALAFAPALPAQTMVVPSSSPAPTGNGLSGGFATFDVEGEKKKQNRSAATITSALRSDLPLFQRGPVGIRPHVRYRFLYGDGIEAGPNNPRDTTIQSFTPGALIEIGKHWSIDYTPTWTSYSNRAFRDTFDQIVSLNGKLPYRDWVFGTAQSYETTHAMLVETGRQTKQERISSSLSAVRNIGRRTQLELGVSRSVRYANAVTEAPEWTTSDWLQYATTNWLRYQFSPRFDVAAGISLGYADVSVGDDMTFTQPQVQLSWRPTDKISLGVQAGRESRSFSGDNDATLSSPVYSASLGYQPHTTTKIQLSASRSISASYFANEITKGDGWSAGLQQRLLMRFFLDASYSENATSYVATRNLLTARREDTYRSVNARLSTLLFQRSSLSLIYQTGRNTSDEEAYAFVTHQFGVEVSHRF